MTYIFSPAARSDLRECIEYLDDQRPGLGDALVDVIDSGIQEILSAPRMFGRVEWRDDTPETRVFPARRFKHFITYVVEVDRIVILAIDRNKRRPSVLRSRLKTYKAQRSEEP